MPKNRLNSTSAPKLRRLYCSQNEVVVDHSFRTLNEAREIIERWLNEYNSERPYESLNNLTPKEYRLMTENTEISKSTWN
ncbi:integrase core domain-containing protein [Yersinia similis]|uniref:integrase core domain-containing protein n=1 Tax=Yersinia similis TaxID=367190 RepID=UPI003704382D